jgi:hypothetical protein
LSELIKERVCAEVDGDVVVFLIGMRINKLWRFWKWFPVARAMPRMLKELAGHPELGMLSARGHFGVRNLMVLQYWKSAEHLQAFAHSSGNAHLPAWQALNKNIGSDGDVGIWHETYVVPKGHAESVTMIRLPARLMCGVRSVGEDSRKMTRHPGVGHLVDGGFTSHSRAHWLNASGC